MYANNTGSFRYTFQSVDSVFFFRVLGMPWLVTGRFFGHLLIKEKDGSKFDMLTFDTYTNSLKEKQNVRITRQTLQWTQKLI